MRLHPQTHALTAVTYNIRRLFQRTAVAELFIATMFRYRDAGKFKIQAFVVMPDHIHVVLTPSPDQTIENCAQLLKGGFSFAVRKVVTGEIWQDSYHAHRVVDDEDLRSQIFYVANNPIRKRYEDYPHVHTNAAYANHLDPT